MMMRVGWEPRFSSFVPVGAKGAKESVLAVEEAEALRLADAEGMAQEDCAKKMKISQPTFSRLVAEARRKSALAITGGMAIAIRGGNYMDQKGVPKMDGSGRGVRANRGRGGCAPPQDAGLRTTGAVFGRGGGRGRGCRGMGRGYYPAAPAQQSAPSSGLEARMDALEGKMEAIGSKLDKLLSKKE